MSTPAKKPSKTTLKSPKQSPAGSPDSAAGKVVSAPAVNDRALREDTPSAGSPPSKVGVKKTALRRPIQIPLPAPKGRKGKDENDDDVTDTIGLGLPSTLALSECPRREGAQSDRHRTKAKDGKHEFCSCPQNKAHQLNCSLDRKSPMCSTAGGIPLSLLDAFDVADTVAQDLGSGGTDSGKTTKQKEAKEHKEQEKAKEEKGRKEEKGERKEEKAKPKK